MEKLTPKDIIEAGPSTGLDLLYAGVRTGAINQEEFVQCVAAIVSQTVSALEDLEDDAADEAIMMTQLLSSVALPVC